MIKQKQVITAEAIPEIELDTNNEKTELAIKKITILSINNMVDVRE